jgi:hypothetical protein
MHKDSAKTIQGKSNIIIIIITLFNKYYYNYYYNNYINFNYYF